MFRSVSLTGVDMVCGQTVTEGNFTLGESFGVVSVANRLSCSFSTDIQILRSTFNRRSELEDIIYIPLSEEAEE